MIRELHDVHIYTSALAAEYPELAGEIVLDRSIDPVDSIFKLNKIPGLPPLYKGVAREWRLSGISLGYFSLYPNSRTASDLAESILDLHCANVPWALEARAQKMVIVASEEANPICVGGASSDYPDIVFAMDITTSPVVTIKDIAENFQEFVLLAANLHQISYSHALVASERPRALEQVCAALGCTVGRAQFWQSKLAELAS